MTLVLVVRSSAGAPTGAATDGSEAVADATPRCALAPARHCSVPVSAVVPNSNGGERLRGVRVQWRRRRRSCALRVHYLCEKERVESAHGARREWERALRAERTRAPAPGSLLLLQPRKRVWNTVAASVARAWLMPAQNTHLSPSPCRIHTGITLMATGRERENVGVLRC